MYLVFIKFKVIVDQFPKQTSDYIEISVNTYISKTSKHKSKRQKFMHVM